MSPQPTVLMLHREARSALGTKVKNAHGIPELHLFYGQRCGCIGERMNQ